MSAPSGRRIAARRSALVLALGGIAAAVAIPLQLPDAGAGAPAQAAAGSAPATPQPVLGTADRDTVIMGAATAGQPGEAWAYRVLPLETSPPSPSSSTDAFAKAAEGGAAKGQLVFERATDADPDWSIVETPLNEKGETYRGMEPDRPSARITPHGGGLLLGEDSSRPSGKQVVVLARNPGGRFQMLPEPSDEVLSGVAEVVAPEGESMEGEGKSGEGEGKSGEGEGKSGEGEGKSGEGEGTKASESGSETIAAALALNNGSGAVADAAVEGSGKTEAYFGALGVKRDDAVIRWNGSVWSREPVELPEGYEGAFTIVSIAGSSPQNMWLLGQGSKESGLGVMLFRRVEEAESARWEQVKLGAPLFEAAETPAAGVSALSALGDPAQPLSVTGTGVWIDGSFQASGSGAEGYDFTLYYGIEAEKVTGSWCEGTSIEGGGALCEHALEARFNLTTGYRSFAFEGPGYGKRIITDPLRSDGKSGLGSYLSLEGSDFRRMPGAGADNVPGGAFYSAEDGWLEGPVQITSEPLPKDIASWPVSARAPLTAVTTAPGTSSGEAGAQALAVGADGVVERYTPGKGWEREFLLNAAGEVTSPTLRAVAWPQKNLAFAVGNEGAMWIWRGETGYWYKDPATPLEGFQGNLMGIAFDPANSGIGYAVGNDGTFMRYGKTWEQLKFGAPASAGEETLPAELSKTEFTSIAYAGDEALVAANQDLLVNEGSGWKVEPEVQALLASLPGEPKLYSVAGLPNGGAVVAGTDVVLERNSAGAPWHFSEQPLVNETAVAAAALLEGSTVRALVSVVPEFEYPPTLVLPPTEPDTPGPVIPANPLPGDGYLVRETAQGWEDEQRSDYAGDSEDKPVKSDPIAAFDVSPNGTGWAVGGWSGESDAAGRGTDAKGAGGQAIRERVETAGIYSYSDAGEPAPAPEVSSAKIPLQEGVATFAVAGHAECAEQCAPLADEGIAPDRNLEEALSDIGKLSSEANGPRMLLYTGGRETPGEGPESSEEAQRYAQLLGSGGGLPVYPALSAGDTEGETASAFMSAFAGFDAPFGEGATPAGVSTAGIPEGAVKPGPGARTHYAFDSTGLGGTVRVIVIDNSRGSLEASNPYQNPAEPQRPWLEKMLANAKERGIPAIVVGSRELNPDLPPADNVATDAEEEAEVLVKGGASAYLYERPEESRESSIPAGGKTTIPEFGTGALGYRSPVSDSFTAGQPDALFGTTGYLLVSVDAAQRNPTTNVAPVTSRLIPLLQSISLDPVDGTLLRRSSPALFQGLGRRPVAGDRWGPSSGATGSPEPSGSDPYTIFPVEQCLQADCGSRIEPEYSFSSSEPEIANFVEQDPESTNLRKPLQDSSGHVIPDSRSGILCAFNEGTTTVTISAGGLSYSVPVTVLGGSVEQPCGTVPLSPSHFKQQQSPEVATPASPPPPSPAPAPAPIAPPPPPSPPPAAAVPAAKPVLKPVPKPVVHAPLPFTPLQPVKLAAGVPPAIPPPPAAAFARPIPPGGATIRVFEEKREEEPEVEQSQAFAARRAGAHGLPQAARTRAAERGNRQAGLARARHAGQAHARHASPRHGAEPRSPAPRGPSGGARLENQPIAIREGGSALALYLLAGSGMIALVGAGIGLGSARRRRFTSAARSSRRRSQRVRPAYATIDRAPSKHARSKQPRRPAT